MEAKPLGQELDEIAYELHTKEKLSHELGDLVGTVMGLSRQIQDGTDRLSEIEIELADIERAEAQAAQARCRAGWEPDYTPTAFDGEEKQVDETEAAQDETLLNWHNKIMLQHEAKMLASNLALKKEALARIGPLARKHFYACMEAGESLPLPFAMDELGFTPDTVLHLTNTFQGDLDEEEWEREIMSQHSRGSRAVEVSEKTASEVCKELSQKNWKILKVSWDSEVKKYNPDERQVCDVQVCFSFMEKMKPGHVMHLKHYDLSSFCIRRGPVLHPNFLGQRVIGKQVGFQLKHCQLYGLSMLVVELPDVLPNDVDRVVYINQYKRYAQIFAGSNIQKIIIAHKDS